MDLCRHYGHLDKSEGMMTLTNRTITKGGHCHIVYIISYDIEVAFSLQYRHIVKRRTRKECPL